jgi:hypothetical protein
MSFNKTIFDTALTQEYATQFNLSTDITLAEQKIQVDRVTTKCEEINKLVASGATLGEVLDSLTTKDVYETTLKRYNNNRDKIFACGIERTLLVVQGQNPKKSRLEYIKDNERNGFSEEEVKYGYITTILFDCFMTYCIKNKFTESESYRLFIRLLCLSDGNAVFVPLLQLSEKSIFLNPQNASPPSSPSSSPSAPSATIGEINKNIITESSGKLFLTTVSIYGLVNTSTSFFSQPFQIPIMYDLIGLSNHPFKFLFSTLSYLNEDLSEIEFNSFTQLIDRKKQVEAAKTNRNLRWNFKAGSKKSRCKHLHSRHKKNDKKYTRRRHKSKMYKNKYRKHNF